jgi:hypothetical protein
LKWNQRDVSFWKYFKKSSFFYQRPNTRHSTYVVLWLSCILKKKLSRCKIEIAFSMIFCVNFNLWSWVHHLMARDEMTFCEFKRNKMLKSKLEALSWKIVSFLALILLAYIITSNLIHEAMTLLEKLFKF